MPKVINAKALGNAPLPHTYIHNQPFPASTWIIAHDLQGKMPAVSIVDSAGSVVVGDVHYGIENLVTITFAAEFSGTAYLN